VWGGGVLMNAVINLWAS